MLANFSIVYCNLFTDQFWLTLTACDLIDNRDQVLQRIMSYLETCRSNQYKKLTFQIGELAVNDDLERTIPFIAEIKIDLARVETETYKNNLNDHRKSALVTSNSLPHFFNNMTSSNSMLLNANPSVDSSYLTSIEATTTTTDNEFELQLDYWRMERITGVMSNNENHHNSDEYSAQTTGAATKSESAKSKIKERSITGYFQHILIYRRPISCDSQNLRNKNIRKSSINCAKSHGSSSGSNMSKMVQEFLSLDYVLREKKQKMRLTTRKSGIKTNHKEINKISKLNLKQSELKTFTIRLDGIEMKNINSIEVSCDYENKYLQLYIIIP